MADTEDGTWLIRPVNAGSSASTAARVMPAAPAAETTSPSASSVTVDWPSRIVAV